LLNKRGVGEPLTMVEAPVTPPAAIPPHASRDFRVACCIPAHNPGPEFEQTLASFSPSTTPVFLIVVDDASEPPLNVDFAAYGLDGVVLRLPHRGGISRALNAGFGLAFEHGFEFLARMDADDRNLPERFAKQVAFLDSRPEYLAAFGHARLIDAHGSPIGARRSPTDPGALRRAMDLNNVLIHPTAMLRREYVEVYGLFSEQARYAQDYDYFMRGVIAGRAAVMDDYLIDYRITGASVSFAKYRGQLASRLRIQLRYLGDAGARGLLGIARTLSLLFLATVLPPRLVGALRRTALRLRSAS
jgi:glycosyltransferase involved in cell wall biosynthesis